MKVSEMVQVTIETAELLNRNVDRPWSIEAMIIELAGEVGSLADAIMITEKYRKPRVERDINLEDAIVDVFFILIRIADFYNIDIESVYPKVIEQTRQKQIPR